MPENNPQTDNIEVICEQARDRVVSLGPFYLQALQTFIHTVGILDTKILRECWGSTVEIEGQKAGLVREAIQTIREVFGDRVKLFKLVKGNRPNADGFFDVKLRESEEAQHIFQIICRVDGCSGEGAESDNAVSEVDFICPDTARVVRVGSKAYKAYLSTVSVSNKERCARSQRALGALPLHFLQVWGKKLSKNTRGVYSYMRRSRRGSRKVYVTRASIEFDDRGPILIEPLLGVLGEANRTWDLKIGSLTAGELGFVRYRLSWDIDQSREILRAIRPFLRQKLAEVEAKSPARVETSQEPEVVESKPTLPKISLEIQRLVLRVLIDKAEEKAVKQQDGAGRRQLLQKLVLLPGRSLGGLVQELSPDGMDSDMKEVLTENQAAVVASVLGVEVNDLNTVGLGVTGVNIYVENASLFMRALIRGSVELGGRIPEAREVVEGPEEQEETSGLDIRVRLFILHELQSRFRNEKAGAKTQVSGQCSTFLDTITRLCGASNPVVIIADELEQELENGPQFVIREAIGTRSLEAVGLTLEVEPDRLVYRDDAKYIVLANSELFSETVSRVIAELEAAMSEDILKLTIDERRFIIDVLSQSLGLISQSTVYKVRDIWLLSQNRFEDAMKIWEGDFEVDEDKLKDLFFTDLEGLIKSALGVSSIEDVGLEIIDNEIFIQKIRKFRSFMIRFTDK